MSASESNEGSRATYDFWLGLIPQFLGQFGGFAPAGGPGTAVPEDLPFPVDQIAKAAAMTQQSLEGLAQALAPALKTGVPDMLAQWAKASPAFAFTRFGDADTATPQTMLAPWLALMSNSTGTGGALPQAPLQAMSRAWADMASRVTGANTAQMDTAFDRTYGALSDGVGLGPARKLQAAWRDVMNAAVAQQDARAQYAILVQDAFVQGFQRLLTALAAKADAGERVDSVLALIRMWAANTEHAVHETLQSERGLAATAALIRSDLAHRKKTQQMATILADQFDMASRRELDEAFREIQALKRELRASDAANSDDAPAGGRAPLRKSTSAKRRRRPDPAIDAGRDDA
ncbi:MAG: hypothetical protein K2Y35_12965 [Burkholderiales bacterium]|nr:hypothetical protein [Burkholderiales bacterium]